MGLVTPVDPVPVGELGKVHFVGHRRRGDVRHRQRSCCPGASQCPAATRRPRACWTSWPRLARGWRSGTRRSNLGDADTVVVSTAIRPDNPELVEAQRRGLRVLHRAAALASVMLGHQGIAVAGTHGKTTTTSMITTVLLHMRRRAVVRDRRDPGRDRPWRGARDRARLFVAEADESDGSFLMLAPDAAVVTSVEADHLDNYGTLAAIEQAFAAFAAKISDRRAAGGLRGRSGRAGAHRGGAARA